MKKIVIAAFAMFALAMSVPAMDASAASVTEAARMGDANGHTGSAN